MDVTTTTTQSTGSGDRGSLHTLPVGRLYVIPHPLTVSFVLSPDVLDTNVFTKYLSKMISTIGSGRALVLILQTLYP